MDQAVPRPALPVLTSLRFFAALVVVLGHLEPQRFGWMPEVLRAWLESGYQAVTFFFVLSGFILVYVYSGKGEQCGLSVSPTRFMVARLARILPAYYLALLLMLPSFAYGFLIAGIVPLGRFVPAIILVPVMAQGWYPPVAFSWNGPAWSLSVEFFFYMLFPVLLKTTSGIERRPFVLMTIGVMIASSVLRLSFFSASPNASMSWDYFCLYFPLFHLSSFLVGMALGRVCLFGPKPPRHLPAILSCVGLSALLAVLGARSILPTWTRTDAVLIPLFSLVIYGGAFLSGRLRQMLSHALVDTAWRGELCDIHRSRSGYLVVALDGR